MECLQYAAVHLHRNQLNHEPGRSIFTKTKVYQMLALNNLKYFKLRDLRVELRHDAEMNIKEIFSLMSPTA